MRFDMSSSANYKEMIAGSERPSDEGHFVDRRSSEVFEYFKDDESYANQRKMSTKDDRPSLSASKQKNRLAARHRARNNEAEEKQRSGSDQSDDFLTQGRPKAQSFQVGRQPVPHVMPNQNKRETHQSFGSSGMTSNSG